MDGAGYHASTIINRYIEMTLHHSSVSSINNHFAIKFSTLNMDLDSASW